MVQRVGQGLSPLPFFVVAAMSATTVPPPGTVPTIFVSPETSAWWAAVGLGPKFASMRPDSSAR
ncbi:hypothetical protein ACFEMC_04485 [Kineococcus sp. DHX-1]|uniref:hypothetical protein n=1 Tax=Kineococcus sp. DHX-1 TaxID=3349638 RepID=UPI0036D29E93